MTGLGVDGPMDRRGSLHILCKRKLSTDITLEMNSSLLGIIKLEKVMELLKYFVFIQKTTPQDNRLMRTSNSRALIF